MSADSLPSVRTREQIAEEQIGHTDISPRSAWFLVSLFLLTIAVPPVAQLGYESLGFQRPADAAPQGPTGPSSLNLLVKLPEVVDQFRATSGSWTTKLLAANDRFLEDARNYERELEERSLLSRVFLGSMQTWLIKFGGAGGNQVDIGREGWLFYHLDVRSLTRPGFLDPRILQQRIRSLQPNNSVTQPDPRRAILECHQQLAARGIRLLIMPVPSKASIYPDKLNRSFEDPRASETSISLQNVSFRPFLDELQSAGVLVFDPTTNLVKARQESSNRELFLRTDTHWTPDGLYHVARALSEIARPLLPPRNPVEFNARSVDVTNIGDTAAMLRLPPHQNLFLPETVTLRQIELSTGEAWQPDSAADVLLLGDSFTNIYSLPEMKWGSSAGLAEQLSFLLSRPIDRIAQNDGGSFMVRQSLLKELAQGHDRLAGKRLVIWQFATRDLVFGDWRLQPMPPVVSESDNAPPNTANPVVIRGTVRAAAGIPRPGSVPYRDAITCLHLTNVECPAESAMPAELLVYSWGLRDNRATIVASYQIGQQISLQVTSWNSVKAQYERLNRIELDDPDFRLVDLPLYWGEPAK